MKIVGSLILFLVVFLWNGSIAQGVRHTALIVKLKSTAQSLSPSRPPAWKEELQQQFNLHTRPLFPRLQKGALSTIEVWGPVPTGDTLALLRELRQQPEVEWAETNRVYRIHAVEPNDPLYYQQWYLSRIGAPNLWNTSLGDSTVIVGVIDTGVDYLHEDLQGQLWVNRAEDLNGNGILDSADINGIDDDGNGYVDDVIGWDFTDAPAFADAGDYTDPDNDPMDEFFSGHGTPVSGIIAAAANNSTGIVGVAPGVKIMALRAGTASGYLEEDDVAEAIVYAVENGARIINMSFGDVAYSYLLRDVIRYGVQKGVIFVASAGNDANDVFQFPAAYDETIAVGATDFQNNLAGFSSYGVKIDLVAPGADLISCKIGNNYGPVSGTSFSAPLVSGALALLWSIVPEATPDVLYGMLLSSARDLGPPGWDNYFGHGLLQVDAAVENLKNGVAKINFPSTNAGVAASSLAIVGSALSANFRYFTLEYGVGANPEQWLPISDKNPFQVVNDTLAVWNIQNLPDTLYTLRLTVYQYFAQPRVATVAFRVDRSPPRLIGFSFKPMFRKNEGGVLVHITSDDLTRVELWAKQNGMPSGHMQSNYLAQDHFLFVNADVLGDGQLEIRLTNSAGLRTIVRGDSFTVPVTILPVTQLKNRFYPYQNWNLAGYLLPEYTDFNRNGLPEIVFSRRTDSTTFGNLVFAELNGDQFQIQEETNFPGIPRDVANVDGRPGDELLAGYGKLTYILSGSEGAFPRNVIWYDTTDFWGSRFFDADGDGEPELLAIHANQWTVFRIKHTGTVTVIPQYQIENPSPGNNQYGVPWCVVADFDGDTIPEIIFGDYDGDVLWAKRGSNGQYAVQWWQRLEGKDATTHLQAGDVDGDGRPEFIAATMVQPDVLLESNFNAQYWVVSVWKYQADNTFRNIATTYVHGVNNQRGIFNGLAVLPNDFLPGGSILFAAYPNLYQFTWEDSILALTGFYQGNFNTNTLLVNDVNQNGRVDFLLATTDGVQIWEDLATATGVYPPFNLQAIPFDTTRIFLSWQSEPADYFKIYRSETDSLFQLLDTTLAFEYTDTSVVANRLYRYVVSAVQVGDTVIESPPSMVAEAIPNPPPVITSVASINPGLIAVTFSEPMADNAFLIENYHLRNGIYPASVTRADGRRRAILGWETPLPPGNYELVLKNMTDTQRTPLNPDSVVLSFTVSGEAPSFYARQVTAFSKTQVRIQFNQVVDSLSAKNPENYHFMPACTILKVDIDSNGDEVVLTLAGNNRIGSLGQPYYLTVQNVRSQSGTPLAEPQTFPLVQEAIDLSNVRVFPNPVRANYENELLFGNLPPTSEIFIYAASGQLVQHLQGPVVSGGIRWDLKNNQGQQISSGVYLFVVQWNGKQKMGKFLVIR